MVLFRVLPIVLLAEPEDLAAGQGLQVVADLRQRLLERVRKFVR
jgi:hypothetical protein